MFGPEQKPVNEFKSLMLQGSLSLTLALSLSCHKLLVSTVCACVCVCVCVCVLSQWEFWLIGSQSETLSAARGAFPRGQICLEALAELYPQ